MDKIIKKIWFKNRVLLDNTTQEICKIELDYVTRDFEDWITEIELLRGDSQKLGVIIDDIEMMTHILSDLPE